MASSPFPGFITKTEAATEYRRSVRALTRDLSEAMKKADLDVLQNIKLQTEDGQVIEGEKVTVDLIDELRHQSQNPKWYLRKTWLHETHGLRTEEPPDHSKTAQHTRPKNQHTSTESGDADDEPDEKSVSESRVVALLGEEIQSLREDKDRLYRELEAKNEQFQQFHTLLTNNQELTTQLHVLIKNWHDRFLPDTGKPDTESLPSLEVPRPITETIAGTSPMPAPVSSATTKSGTARPQKRRARAGKQATAKQQASKPKKQRTKKQKPATGFQKHTPSFHRALKSLFRR